MITNAQETVKLCMTRKPVCISEEASLAEAITRLRLLEVSHLLVCDSNFDLIGILSKEDVLNSIYSLAKLTSGSSYTDIKLKNKKVSEFMTKDPISLTSKTSIDMAVELLLQRQFHSIPIVDDGKPIGIVTAYDLLKHYYQKYG